MNANVTFRARTFPLSALLFSLCLITGCSNLAGVGGSTEYACPMPEGSNCKSMSQTYQDSFRRKSSQAQTQTSSSSTVDVSLSSFSFSSSSVEASVTKPQHPELYAEIGTPLLTGPRVMRIFIVPWTDADDNLMDGRRIFVKVEESHWRLDHVKASLVRQYAPIIPPSQPISTPVSSSESVSPNSANSANSAESHAFFHLPIQPVQPSTQSVHPADGTH
jgi:conjugal transfer pilus assembly protein TraV